MFRTGSGKVLELNDIPSAMLDFYNKNKKYGTPISIVVGTDSQNFSDTKIVSVITILCEGHGGIFFYRVSRIPKISNVKMKLEKETGDSLILAGALVDMLEQEEYKEMYESCPLSIHVDAGNSTRGKTKELIPELVGWIRACGYDVKTKPNSFAASCIADKISK